MKIAKRLFTSLILISCALIIQPKSFAQSDEGWSTKVKNVWNQLKWPHDRTEDAVKLLPFGQELKLNYFLQHLHNESGVQVYFKLIPSLQGADFATKVEESLREIMDEDIEGRYLLFFLSLSDRQFKILPSQNLESEVDEAQLKNWVGQLIPSLKRQNYPKAIEDFLQVLLYKFAPRENIKVPELSLNKSYNLNSLLFFVVGFLVIFMLGHKLRKGPRVLEKDGALVKKKTSNITLFW